MTARAASATSPPRNVLLRGLAILAGLLAAAAIGEAGLRLGGYAPTYVNPLHAFHEAHPLVGYRGRPNFTGRFRRPDFDVVVSHDALGFRAQAFQHPEAGSRHRVLVFGDSFTWGWGVGQGEVFTDRIGQRMPDTEVMNFGLNASGTVEQFTLFEAYGRPRLRPGDAVVLQFSSNDFKDNVSGRLHGEVRDGEVRRVGPGPIARTRRLADVSYLVNVLSFAGNVAMARLRERRAAERAPRLVDLGDQSAEIVVTRHFLRQFRQAVEQRQARFVAVFAPQPGELGESPSPSDTGARNERGYRTAFDACARAAGVSTLDLLPAFLEAKRARPQERLTFRHDPHWTARGHEVAGRAIAAFILASRQAPPPAGP